MEGQAFDIAGAAKSILSTAGRERPATSEYAAARAQEEKDISESALAYLTGEREARTGDLSERARVANENAAKLEAAYQSFVETGSLDALKEVVDPETAAMLDQVFTGPAEREKAAKKLYGEILSSPAYSSIQSIEPATIGIDNAGRERLYVTIGGKLYTLDNLLIGRDVIGGMDPAESQALAKLIHDRQIELEVSFSPQTQRTQGLVGLESSTGRLLSGTEPPAGPLVSATEQYGGRGSYADVLPLYGPQLGMVPPAPWPDLSGVINYAEASEATPSTVATQAEVDELNRIAELLGVDQRMMKGDRAAPSISTVPADVAAFNQLSYDAYVDRLADLLAGEQAQRASAQEIYEAHEASGYRPGAGLQALLDIPTGIAAGYGLEQLIPDRTLAGIEPMTVEELAALYGITPPGQRPSGEKAPMRHTQGGK
jgi:hypothetical protein